MTKAVTRYTEKDKLSAVEAFFMTRSSKKASEITGIPASTIRRWKKDAETWAGHMEIVKAKANDKLDGTLTTILEKSANKILRALEEGDQKMNPQGEIVFVPVPAAELARIQKQAYDQRAQIRGEDTAGAKRAFSMDDLKKAFEESAFKAKRQDDKVLDIDNSERIVNE